MAPRFTFTQRDADELRRLINQKVKAPAEQQKGIREKIRAKGFYWTKTSRGGEKIPGGYTVADFDGLIESGEIRIIP